MKQRNIMDMVYLSHRKDFSEVLWNSLLNKMVKYELDETSIAWICLWLNDYTLRLFINGSTWAWKDVSITLSLGSIMFLPKSWMSELKGRLIMIVDGIKLILKVIREGWLILRRDKSQIGWASKNRELNWTRWNLTRRNVKFSMWIGKMKVRCITLLTNFWNANFCWCEQTCP